MVRGRVGILGALGAVKERLTHSAGRGDQTTGHEHEGVQPRDAAGSGEKIEVYTEETPSGRVAAALKSSDQMTGQTFNDVGRMDEEGVVRVDRHGKM